MTDDALWAAVAAGNLCTLATIKRDGTPQLSDVNYTADDTTRTLRISTIATLAKVHNLRRDPRAAIRIGPPTGGYIAGDATATFSEPARTEDDPTVEELIDVYRRIAGKDHPDWPDYRRAMVADSRLVLTLTITRLYGWLGA